MVKRTSEAAFETAIEEVLLTQGYEKHDSQSFDREQTIFPEVALDFIRTTLAKTWEKLEALHGDKTGKQVLETLCKWMDREGSLATLRHGFKCFGKDPAYRTLLPCAWPQPRPRGGLPGNRLGIIKQLHFSPKSEYLNSIASGQLLSYPPSPDSACLIVWAWDALQIR